MAGIKLGEILVKEGLIRPEQMSRALEEQKKSGGKIGTVLVQQGIIKEAQLLKVLESHFHLPGIDLGNFKIADNVIQMITKEICIKHTLIPVQKVGSSTLVVAFADPSNQNVREDLRFLTRHKIQPVVATENAILLAIEKHHGGNVSALGMDVDGENFEVEVIDDKKNDLNEEEEGPIIKFVNAVLNDAILKKASDIHFEPYEKRFRVRLRVDGSMVETTTQSTSSAAAIASRVKIMAKLDIAEKRRPQDGRIKLRTTGKREMDFRVSVMPTIWGEKIVLRLLDKSNLQLDMTKLGFEPDDLKIFKDAIQVPQGLLLITGPTGSGKTTTIYSALAELNQPDVNISTAEDPVEFNLEGINQVQMNPDIDLTFANALRSFLRQDPDIIMVGEIRDLETAEIAMKAASTGHLVVSTLHTNDAPQTVARLTEMGIAPYIVTSTVTLIVAQRLVGKICENCKVPVVVEPKVLQKLGIAEKDIPEYKIFKGKGCSNCNGTGIKGRIAIFELMQMTENIKESILKGASASEIRNLAMQEGLKTLRRSALLKLKRGETTIEEVVNSSVKDTL